jgi:tRNA(Ile)-lysidine synthase
MLPFREDESNRDRRFLRNRVRHELLPLLERDYNPNVRAALVQLAQQSQGEHELLEAAAGRVWRRVSRELRGGGVAISVERFLAQPVALQRQLLRRAIQHVRGELGRLEFRHWREAEELFHDRPAGTLVDLPSGVQLRKDAGRVICRRQAG